jgi:hypothetical protein
MGRQRHHTSSDTSDIGEGHSRGTPNWVDRRPFGLRQVQREQLEDETVNHGRLHLCLQSAPEHALAEDVQVWLTDALAKKKKPRMHSSHLQRSTRTPAWLS